MATFRAPKPYSVVGTVGNARHMLQRGYGNGGGEVRPAEYRRSYGGELQSCSLAADRRGYGDDLQPICGST